MIDRLAEYELLSRMPGSKTYAAKKRKQYADSQIPLTVVVTHNWGAGTELFEDLTMGKFSQMRFVFLHFR